MAVRDTCTQKTPGVHPASLDCQLVWQDAPGDLEVRVRSPENVNRTPPPRRAETSPVHVRQRRLPQLGRHCDLGQARGDKQQVENPKLHQRRRAAHLMCPTDLNVYGPRLRPATARDQANLWRPRSRAPSAIGGDPPPATSPVLATEAHPNNVTPATDQEPSPTLPWESVAHRY